MSMKGPRLAHVVLQSSRRDAMAEFYAKVINGHIVFSGGGLTFLTCDEEHHRIAIGDLSDGAEPKNPKASGMNHMAFTFDSLDDLLDHYQRLATEDLRPTVTVQHGVTTSLYYSDPDGNFVELQVDNFDTPQEATAFLEGPEFEEDSIGPQFDVDRMVEARANGASVAELTSRAWVLTGPELPHPSVVLAHLEPQGMTQSIAVKGAL
jgi:hypothetical protein